VTDEVQPTTWQEAAAAAVADIRNTLTTSFVVRDVGPDRLYKHLRAIMERERGERDFSQDPALFWLPWHLEFRGLAVSAYCCAETVGYPVKLDDELVELLAGKQADYGPNNILEFGNTGLMIRLHDKLARLQNLLGKRNGQASNETVDDTFTDVIGYAVVGYLLNQGWFELPLAGELGQRAEAVNAEERKRDQEMNVATDERYLVNQELTDD
jgi:hypothetical protein